MSSFSGKSGCLGILFRALGLLPPAPFRYGPKPLLSPAERSFLGVLEHALPPGMRVFSKVRIADVLKVLERGSRWRPAFNRISQRHADFVVCDAGDLVILFVIELDDSSHASSRSMASDEVKNQVFASSGVRLVRVRAKRNYAVEELRALLFPLPPSLP
jgi:hypothetical protein